MKNRLFYFIRKKPRKEEESLRQELGKQEGEARKGGARGSPSLGRLCPGSGNLSSGQLVVACALLQVVIPPVPLVFSTVLESEVAVMSRPQYSDRFHVSPEFHQFQAFLSQQEDARLNLKELTRFT
ncbi:hypothetical protein AAZX31_06G211400 [Glycine max]|uniref:Uncharacterized protein n=2 Tax=Glycine subgen. Soja TaxID=1462606 RepID=A0A0R0JKI5_SOYBN|nr:hypothetical protein JHK85_016514 [Glycine max]KAG5046737.1 hypothetical protein JHK86_016143 [Glycine max]KAG5149233.1 hypothetical protein JHK82_016114 [Glycine max]KRH55009.1 hypothetical protein GLYMA_06G224900v4 [Glycine max]RZC08754.1 hypothetical protein D0Y65_015459 [Glycine soja]